MFEVNLCGPLYDTLPNGTSIRAIRLIMISNLLIMYVVYLIISFLLNKTVNALKLQDQAGNTQIIAQKQKRLKLWEKQYLLTFGDHAVALGFVLSFSPYVFEVIVSILFVIARIAYEIRLHKFNDSLTFIKTILRIINLSLMVAAMLGLSRMYQKQDTTCLDSTFTPLSL